MNEKRWRMKKKLTALFFVIIASISLAGCGRRFQGEYTYELANAIAKELQMDGKAEYEEVNEKELCKNSKARYESLHILLFQYGATKLIKKEYTYFYIPIWDSTL